MTQIIASELYNAFSAGCKAIIAEKDYLNQINVFPVPDGDTGSNLSFTLQSAIDNSNLSDSAGITLQSIAKAALMGARGNSGILFAQFISGMAEKVGDLNSIDIDTFIQSAGHAVNTAYDAISEPVEGTMLTVMREWANSMSTLSNEKSTFQDLLKHSFSYAVKSLEKTKDTLAQLKEANVIDAGAKGFVLFLEGFEEFLVNGKEHNPDLHLQDTVPHINNHDGIKKKEEIHFRYCTEGFIKSDNLNLKKIRETIQNLGDSLIVAGNNKACRVHIHTNDPAEVFHQLSQFGTLGLQKADDMLRQFEMMNQRKNNIAVVVDSTCDLPQSFIDEHQIYQVPLYLDFGGISYLDRVTINTEQFYHKLQTSKHFPKTSQPTSADFSRLYDQLSTFYPQILSIHISSKISGTFSTSTVEAAKYGKDKIRVFDSLESAVGFGILVMSAISDIEQGLSIDDIIKNLHTNRKNLLTLIYLPSLDNLIRGGRISHLKGVIGKLLHLKPILYFDEEGKFNTYDKAFSSKSAKDKIIRHIEAKHKQSPIKKWALVHAHDYENALKFAKRVAAVIESPAAYITEISPALGAQAGVSGIAVSILQ